MMELIKTKHILLDKHLDFIVKMLKRFEKTKFGPQWKHMHDCITSDRKVMTIDQINRLNSKLIEYQVKYQPENNHERNRSTSNNKPLTKNPREQQRSPIRFPVSTSSTDGREAGTRSAQANYHQASYDDYSKDAPTNANRDPRLNRLVGSDARHFQNRSISPRGRPSTSRDIPELHKNYDMNREDYRYRAHSRNSSSARPDRSRSTSIKKTRERSKSRPYSRRSCFLNSKSKSPPSRHFADSRSNERSQSLFAAKHQPKRRDDDLRYQISSRHSNSPYDRLQECQPRTSVSKTNAENNLALFNSRKGAPHRLPPRRKSFYLPDSTSTFEPVDKFSKTRIVNDLPQRKLPRRRMSCYHQSQESSAQHVSTHLNDKPILSNRKIPKRRMSCHPQSFKQNVDKTYQESLITAKLRLLGDQFSNQQILKFSGLPETASSTDFHEHKRRRLNSGPSTEGGASCSATKDDFMHPRFEGPKLRSESCKQKVSLDEDSVKSKDQEKTSSANLKPAMTSPHPTLSASTNSMLSYKIPKLKSTAISATEDCETISQSQDLSSIASSSDSVVEKVKSFTENHLEKKEGKTEELVKNLEKALGRETLLKLKSILVQDQVPDRIEDQSSLVVSTRDDTREAVSTSSSSIDKGAKSTQSKPEERNVPDKCTRKEKQTAIVSTSEETLAQVKNKQAVKPSVKPTSRKQKQELKPTSPARKEQSKIKYFAAKSTSKTEKQSPNKASHTKKAGIQSVASSPGTSKNLQGAQKKTELKTTKRNTNKSTTADKTHKERPTSESDAKLVKKRHLNELDRLHMDINQCFDSYGIVHASGRRACTMPIKVRQVDLCLDEEYIKKFDVMHCVVNVNRLNLKDEPMPVLINRQFVLKHPEIQKELDTYLDMMEEDNLSIGSSNSSLIPLAENLEKVKSPEKKQNVSVPEKHKSKSPVSKSKSVINRKRSNWSHGIIVKKRRKTNLAPDVDEEWEDVPETKPKTKKVQYRVKLNKLVEFMSSFDKKKEVNLKPTEVTKEIINQSSVVFIINETRTRLKCELCPFESAEMEDCIKHLKLKHPMHIWTNFCQVCDKSIESSEDSIECTFNHMMTHIDINQNGDLLKELPKASSKPILKFRSLPGDKLSTFSVPLKPEDTLRGPISQSKPAAKGEISPSKPAAKGEISPSKPAAKGEISPSKPAAIVKPRLSDFGTGLALPKFVLKPSHKFIRISPPSSTATSVSTDKLSIVSSLQRLLTSNQVPVTSTAPQTTSSPQQSTSKATPSSIINTRDAPRIIPNLQHLKVTQMNANSFSVVPMKVKMPPIKSEVVAHDEEFVDNKKLRPWLSDSRGNKKVKAFTEMLKSQNCLAALFKCMGHSCSFFTSDKTVFEKHLLRHIRYRMNDELNFLMCSYCTVLAVDISFLIAHIMKEHAYDKYQCGYCFYRAYSDFHVFHQHQNSYHKHRKKIVIECEPSKPLNINIEMLKIKKTIPEFIPDFKCTVCMKPFYVFDLYKQHADSHKERVSQTCRKCHEVLMGATSIIVHLQNCFKFGIFHCVYCRFGASEFVNIDNHLAENHSSQLPIFCERVEASGNQTIDPSSISSMAIKRVSKSTMSCVKVKTNPEQLINLENFENIGIDVIQLKDSMVKKTNEPSAVATHFIDLEQEPRMTTFSKPAAEVNSKQSLQIQKVVSLFEMRADSSDNVADLEDIELFDFNNEVINL